MRLVGIALFGAALVPITAVRAAATTLTCGYLAGSPGVVDTTMCGEGFHNGAVFNFGSYAAELMFDQVNVDFTVTIEDVHQDLDTMLERLSAFPGYQPVPIDPGNTAAPYVDFQITAPAPGDDTWTSDGGRGPVSGSVGYELWLYWLADTDAGYPNPQVFHQTGETDGTFDSLITMPGTYFNDFPEDQNPCLIFICIDSIDPGVGGRDNMFSASFTLADNSAVPEPASLLLLGSGVSAMLYRRRRSQRARD